MRVALFSSGRLDWDSLEPIAQALHRAPDFEVFPILGGLHCQAAPPPRSLGGVPIADWVDVGQTLDSGGSAVAQAAGWTACLLAGSLRRLGAEALMVVGGRTDALAAGMAALCLRLPILHLHGGEATANMLGNHCRDAVSMMAALHFVAHPAFEARLVRMGVPPDRVVVSGAPALDPIATFHPLPSAVLARLLGQEPMPEAFVVLKHHATPIGSVDAVYAVTPLVEALEAWLPEAPDTLVVVLKPEQSAGEDAAWRELQALRDRRPDRVVLRESMGLAYFSLLKGARFLLGNTSSGLFEAPSFGLPVINVGDRQQGRIRGANILDVAPEPGSILEALRSATQPGTKERLAGLVSPYGDGRAAERILKSLRENGRRLGFAEALRGA